MSEVQFEEESSQYVPREEQKFSLMVRMLMKLGIAKDESDANKVLVIFSIIIFLIAVFVFVHYVLGYNPFAKKVTPNYNGLPPSLQQLLHHSTSTVTNNLPASQ